MAQRSPRNDRYTDPDRRVQTRSRYDDSRYDDTRYSRSYYDDSARQRSQRHSRESQYRYDSERAAAGSTGAASGSGRQARPSSASGAGSRQYHDERRQYPAPKKRKKKRKGAAAAVIIIIVVLIAAGAGIFAWQSGLFENKEAEVIEDNRPLPASPAVARTATIGVTGDIILHRPIFESCETDYGYDFSGIFRNISQVYDQTDLMIANLEVTLGGTESGEYTSYPAFNSPDEIVPALKNAGVDICLTANNHSNDTGYYGMMRTLDILDEYGVDHLGSREDTDEHFLMIKNVNGIRLGMVCYTYDTREYTDGEKSLNFNYLSDEAVRKIQTFNYEYLDEFYQEMEEHLYYMDMLGVDAKIVFIHWGTEYQDDPNDYQQIQIARRLCEMGVDVIIGGHPHVVQRFETLTSTSGHETICLYSTGNQLSNQRTDLMLDEDGGRGYTEDGVVIQITFEKFNNGKTKTGAVNIVPTWVQLNAGTYQIIGMDSSDPWSWGAADTYAAIDSYNRTLERLGDDYIAYRERKNQSPVTEYIS